MPDDKLAQLRAVGFADMRTDIRQLTLVVDGRSFTYVADCRGRDPDEMTLGEWMAFPRLSAEALLADLVENHTNTGECHYD